MQNKNNIILIIIWILFQYNASSQTKVKTILHQRDHIFEQKVHGNFLYFFTGSDNFYSCNFMRMQLPDGPLEYIDSNIQYCQNVKFSDSGIYYVTFKYLTNTNGGQHFLNFCKYSNHVSSIGTINDYIAQGKSVRPSYESIINNRFYTRVYYDNQYRLIESDGTDTGTKSIYQSNNEIYGFIFLKKTLYIIEAKNQVNFFLDASNKRVSPLYSFQSQNPIYIYYHSDSLLIYNVGNKLFKTNDFKFIDSTIYKIPKYPGPYIINNDSFCIGITNSNNLLETYKLGLYPPYSYDTLPFSYLLQNYNEVGAMVREGPYLNAWSFNTGMELSYLSFNDSFKIIKDLNPGKKNSIFEEIYSKNLLVHDTIFYLANNGSNNMRYLYATDNKNTWSYFPISKIDDRSDKFIYNNVFFWSYSNIDTVFIYSKSLNDKDTQPIIKYQSIETSEEWHRSLAPVSKNHQYSNYFNSFNSIESRKLLVDKSENIIACGLTHDIALDNIIAYSDTSLLTFQNGAYICVKYDKNGNVRWGKTFGSLKNNFELDPKFTLDNNGDIIVFGLYFERVQFGNIQLTTPRAAMFVAKINGKTGDFLWAKSFNPQYWANDFTSDGIVVDSDNNIYLSLTYKEFSANFDNQNITAIIGPMNAIVKLNYNGEAIWAKNCPTPWHDYYGLNRSFTYDFKENVLFSVISQAYYNSSSTCLYYGFANYIAKVNTNGEILGDYGFYGDDLNAAICAIPTENNSIFITGFYRNKLQMNHYSLSSENDSKNNCSYNSNFCSVLNAQILQPLNLIGEKNFAFYPYDIAKDKLYIYVLGSEADLPNKNFNLCVRKYTHFGRLIAKRYFKVKLSTPFNFNYYYNLAITDKNLIIAMSSQNTIPPFNNFVEDHVGLSVYKLIKDKDWIEVQSFDDEEIKPGLVISPNPTKDYLNIQFLDDNVFQEVEIINVLGQTIKTISLNNEIYQTINFEGLQSGPYVFVFKGTKTTIRKIIIE